MGEAADTTTGALSSAAVDFGMQAEHVEKFYAEGSLADNTSDSTTPAPTVEAGTGATRPTTIEGPCLFTDELLSEEE